MSITSNKDATRTQTYIYDSLNRITSGYSAAATGASSWGENYTIDAWGNLMISPLSGKAHGGLFQHAGDINNHASGLGYDAAEISPTTPDPISTSMMPRTVFRAPLALPTPTMLTGIAWKNPVARPALFTGMGHRDHSRVRSHGRSEI